VHRFFFEGEEEMTEGTVKAERVRVEPLISHNVVRIYEKREGGEI